MSLLRLRIMVLGFHLKSCPTSSILFTTKGVGEGTSLGLSTVRTIVRKHGGNFQGSSNRARLAFRYGFRAWNSGIILPVSDPGQCAGHIATSHGSLSIEGPHFSVRMGHLLYASSRQAITRSTTPHSRRFLWWRQCDGGFAAMHPENESLLQIQPHRGIGMAQIAD
jgi:hypothetical protein